MLMLVVVVLFCGSVPVFAESAPPLTVAKITDFTFDDTDNMQLYVEVTELGTSRGRYVWANNILCDENINATSYIWNYANIRTGARRYFKIDGVYGIETPYGYTTNRPGQTYEIRVRFDNAMAPWDSKSDSFTVTLP